MIRLHKAYINRFQSWNLDLIKEEIKSLPLGPIVLIQIQYTNLINQGTCSFLKSSFSNYKYNYYIKQFVKTLFYSGGMEHLSIFMWIKVHHNQNINRFRIFKSYNILLKILLKKFIFKNFLKRKKFKIPSGIPTPYLQICSEPSNLLRYAVR